jgi:hypothetical protein
MPSLLSELPPEHLSLLNSLLRNENNSVREVARMTYEVMGNIGHRRSLRAYEACLYRHKEAGLHLCVVRQDNVMKDPFIVSDIIIKALEAQITSETPPNLTALSSLLNSIKMAKGSPVSLMSKLESDVIDKIEKLSKLPDSVEEKPNCLPRTDDPNYV